MRSDFQLFGVIFFFEDFDVTFRNDIITFATYYGQNSLLVVSKYQGKFGQHNLIFSENCVKSKI